MNHPNASSDKLSRDSLGDRMKSQYESRTRYALPRRTYTIIRVDGKAFHTYTRGCERPFDAALMHDMDLTAIALCEQIEGAQFAYVQSDEISLLLTDFQGTQTQAWFDGSIQKIASISASIATARFNAARWQRIGTMSDQMPMAQFDSRVFTIPDPVEVFNYFQWRQQDASRNSISMVAQANFSHALLQGKSSSKMQDMLMLERGINWNDFPPGCKRGRCVIQETVIQDVTYTDKRTGKEETAEGVARSRWVVVAPPIFSQDKQWLASRIPSYGQEAAP